MCPITHTSYLELIAATLASFFFGAIWYGPLFGKTWAQLIGMKISETCKDKKPPVKSLLLTLLGTFLTTWVLAFIIHQPSAPCAAGVALFAWIGYYIPLLLSPIAWENKPWKLFALNAAFYLLNLQLIAGILNYWR